MLRCKWIYPFFHILSETFSMVVLSHMPGKRWLMQNFPLLPKVHGLIGEVLKNILLEASHNGPHLGYQSIKMKGLQTLQSIFSPIIMTDTKWDKDHSLSGGFKVHLSEGDRFYLSHYLTL